MSRPKADPQRMAPLREAIRRSIQRHGWTHSQAAAELGIERRLLTYYVSDLRTLPDPESWASLVRTLDLDEASLLQAIGYLGNAFPSQAVSLDVTTSA